MPVIKASVSGSLDSSTKVTIETPNNSTEERQDFTGVQTSHVHRVWILNEAGGMQSLTNNLKLTGCSVEKYIDVETLFSADASRTLLDEFRVAKPDMLWINVPRNVYGKRAAVLLSTMAYMQVNEHRHVMLEGGPNNMKGVHADKFAKVLSHPRVNSSQVYWCALGIKDEQQRPVCHYTRVLTTLPLPVSTLLCSQHEDKSKLRRFPTCMWNEYYAALTQFSGFQSYAAVPKN